MAKKKAAKEQATFAVQQHVLVPKHEKLSDAERDDLFNKYNISLAELPKINKSDAALEGLDVEEGDVICIRRKSPTAGESIFFRGVIHG